MIGAIALLLVQLSFRFSANLWEYPGEAAWVFVTLPVDDAEEIRELVPRTRGFGSLRVTAAIGDTEWSTSVFPDKATGSYLLPIKKAVRTREGLAIGDDVEVVVSLAFES